MTNKKHTIKDIALLAGVSKGTVDRVLHKRGKVSQKALDKVNQVLQEIDYRPNPMARSLKNNKIYRICVLLPNPNLDTFWIAAEKGVFQAAKEYQHFGIVVETYHYDPKDRYAFAQQSKYLLASKPDGLLMAPLFHEESYTIFKRCQELNVVVATFNNFIGALEKENFIGQDLEKSGRTAANLLNMMLREKSEIAVIHIEEEAHMRYKERGFRSYFEEQHSQHLIHTFTIAADNKDAFYTKATTFFENHPRISAVFITNSKTYRLTEILEKMQKHIIVIGYDLLNKNIQHLKSGLIDFLIHQKPNQQAYLGVQSLAEFFLFEKKIAPRRLLPIDIITAENVDYQHY